MFEFAKDHVDEFLAIIGAAYMLALAVVKLTPTPKDDRAVEKVKGWILAISVLFGLNPFQGVDTKPKGYIPPAVRPKV